MRQQRRYPSQHAALCCAALVAAACLLRSGALLAYAIAYAAFIPKERKIVGTGIYAAFVAVLIYAVLARTYAYAAVAFAASVALSSINRAAHEPPASGERWKYYAEPETERRRQRRVSTPGSDRDGTEPSKRPPENHALSALEWLDENFSLLNRALCNLKPEDELIIEMHLLPDPACAEHIADQLSREGLTAAVSERGIHITFGKENTTCQPT